MAELENIAKDLKSQKLNDDLILCTCKYLWQLICMLGYKPDLDTCSLTNTRRSTQQIPQYFDMENGAITSVKAYRELVRRNPYQDSIRELKSGVFTMLTGFDAGVLNPELVMQSAHIINTLKFLHKHLEYRLHKEFKSWKLVEEILEPSLSVLAA